MPAVAPHLAGSSRVLSCLVLYVCIRVNVVLNVILYLERRVTSLCVFLVTPSLCTCFVCTLCMFREDTRIRCVPYS